MNNYPISFQEQSIMNEFAIQPSDVKGVANKGVEYHKRQLYNKIFSRFEFKLPPEWRINWFRFFLFHLGSIGVIYTNEFGWICAPYGVKKLDPYYNPKQIIVTNSNLEEEKTGIIGINACVIHCFDDYRGFDDIVTRFATDLAQLDKSIEVNLMNCNATVLFKAESKKQADEVREAYAKATQGEPFVAISKEAMDNGLEAMFQSASSNYIVDKLLAARRGIMNNFLTEIGIRNANYEKKERLNSQEVNENNDETSAIISVVFKNLQDGFEQFRSISGLDVGVKLHYSYKDKEDKGNELD